MYRLDGIYIAPILHWTSISYGTKVFSTVYYRVYIKVRVEASFRQVSVEPELVYFSENNEFLLFCWLAHSQCWRRWYERHRCYLHLSEKPRVDTLRSHRQQEDPMRKLEGFTSIGFVILSHSEPEQLLRLTSRLENMFPTSKIICAHDFGQTPLDTRCYPATVSFVTPHVPTRWGHISLVHAAMNGLRKLYERDGPDWFVLLSGSDYPVTDAATIHRDLATGEYDAYLDHREIPLKLIIPEPNSTLYGTNRPEWIADAYARYIAPRVKYPWLTREFRLIRRTLVFRFPSPFHPFRRNMRCFGGDHWFTANRRVAKTLLGEYENGGGLLRYFANRPIPDEAFYHTVICNNANLRVSHDNKRYADWSVYGPHPKFLEIEDIPKISASRSHFARKFRPRSSAIAVLDRDIVRL